MDNLNKIEIDNKLVREMFDRLAIEEDRNVKNLKYTDKQMAERLAKYIKNKTGGSNK